MPCKHIVGLEPVAPKTPGCEECLKLGQRWVHLRLCMTCGHVGCCDSSPGKHASKHFQQSGDPVMASLERGERWAWCFIDRVELPLPPGFEPFMRS